MTKAEPGVVVGVDAHTDTHDAAVLDDCGRLLATATFAANSAGYAQLLAWARRFGAIGVFGSYTQMLWMRLKREAAYLPG